MTHKLRKQCYSTREIARVTGFDRKTIRKRLKEAEFIVNLPK
ncbi:MAG: hypothetical protein ACK4M7_00945 [Burkholderiales bacterium]